MARLTLNGMYEYDPTLFEGMVLPEDYDRDALLFEILQRSGQLYPYHQQPGILKTAIRLWFARNFLNFDRIMEALTAEYNPIENYDRYVDWKRTPDLTDTNEKTGDDTLEHTGKDTLEHSGKDTTEHSGKDTTEHSGKDTTEHSGKDTTDHSGKDTTKNSGKDATEFTYTNYKETLDYSGNHTTEEQVAAYDNSSYQASKKTIETFGDPTARKDEKSITGSRKEELTHGKQEELTHGEKIELEHGEQIDLTHGETIDLTHGETVELTHGLTEDQSYNSKETTTYGSTLTGRHTGTEEYTEHTHGNIGVRSSQELINQEIELRKYDIYVDIAGRFEHEFLVQVY